MSCLMIIYLKLGKWSISTTMNRFLEIIAKVMTTSYNGAYFLNAVSLVCYYCSNFPTVSEAAHKDINLLKTSTIHRETKSDLNLKEKQLKLTRGFCSFIQFLVYVWISLWQIQWQSLLKQRKRLLGIIL